MSSVLRSPTAPILRQTSETTAPSITGPTTTTAPPTPGTTTTPTEPKPSTTTTGFDGGGGTTKPAGIAMTFNAPSRTGPLQVRLGQVAFSPVKPTTTTTATPTTTTTTTTTADPMAITPGEQAAHAALNAKVIKKYPHLAPVLKDPDAFMASMRGRFEAQKQIPGADPYAFDFSEWGVPALEGLSRSIAEKTAELDPFLARLLPTRDKGVEEHIQVAGLLDEMKRDIDGLLEQQKSGEPLPYRRVQELSFYVARTIGLVDVPKMGLRDRFFLEVDRYLQGFQKGTFETEATRYRENDFSVFQKTSPVDGFRNAAGTFEGAFFNPERLEMLALPTIDELGAEPFTRLAPYNIFILGVTKDPAAADGFVRPGGDFYIHDLRHSSAIFHRRRAYETEHGLEQPQIDKLAKRADLWKVELDAARGQIPDKQLRWAIGFVMFNFHHDRGFPMVPSSYEQDTAVDMVPKLLYAMLKMSGQPVGFDKPQQTLEKAMDWLQAFWEPRREQEQAILAGTALPDLPAG